MNSETQQASKTVGFPPYHWKAALPWTGVSGIIGLRDYFAGQALAGMCAAQTQQLPHQTGTRIMAHDAYLAADFMLIARESKGGAA